MPTVLPCDSSFQDCPNSGRSTGGYLIMMFGCWKARPSRWRLLHQLIDQTIAPLVASAWWRKRQIQSLLQSMLWIWSHSRVFDLRPCCLCFSLFWLEIDVQAASQINLKVNEPSLPEISMMMNAVEASSFDHLPIWPYVLVLSSPLFWCEIDSWG